MKLVFSNPFLNQSTRKGVSEVENWKCTIDFRYPYYPRYPRETSKKLESWSDIENTLIEMTSDHEEARKYFQNRQSNLPPTFGSFLLDIFQFLKVRYFFYFILTSSLKLNKVKGFSPR